MKSINKNDADMEQQILNGVGKKPRLAYMRGELDEAAIFRMYQRNKKEADAFCVYGLTARDLYGMIPECHNPILNAKLEACKAMFDEKSRHSSEQNKLSLEKLNGFLDSALGVGLKGVIRKMKKEAKRSKDLTLQVVTTLLEVEFANLSAKSHGKRLKEVIYERKSLLLDNVAAMLDGSTWKYGYNDNCGKNASYIIYVYLPDGTQLSWHTNDYSIYEVFPFIDAEWDGKVCATMEKLLAYIANNYSQFFPSLQKLVA